jgi:hypothetical protein
LFQQRALAAAEPKYVRDKAVVRSFRHPVGAHAQAISHVLTGGTDPTGQAREGFGMGARYARLRGPNHPRTGLPTYAVLTDPHRDRQEGLRAVAAGQAPLDGAPAGRGGVWLRDGAVGRLGHARRRQQLRDQGRHGDAGRPLDRALSAFLEDLQQRGLADRVLVVLTGDFGRTPKINNRGGRDHWANLCTLAFWASGLKTGGQLIGKSDRQNAKPDSKPYSTPNLLSTVMHHLFDVGVLRVTRSAPSTLVKLIDDHKPIEELFA